MSADFGGLMNKRDMYQNLSTYPLCTPSAPPLHPLWIDTDSACLAAAHADARGAAADGPELPAAVPGPVHARLRVLWRALGGGVHVTSGAPRYRRHFQHARDGDDRGRALHEREIYTALVGGVLLVAHGEYS
eukprot:1518437-Pyramimonas_sp.AAC.1